jgi:transcriptional regulator with XRE-family HTH domain
MTTTKINERQTLIQWLATPSELRRPATQKELAKKLGVDAATLSDWKKGSELWVEVRDQLRVWGQGKTSNVLQALYRNIIETGNPTAIRLWLETFGKDTAETKLMSPVALVQWIGEDDQIY